MMSLTEIISWLWNTTIGNVVVVSVLFAAMAAYMLISGRKTMVKCKKCNQQKKGFLNKQGLCEACRNMVAVETASFGFDMPAEISSTGLADRIRRTEDTLGEHLTELESLKVELENVMKEILTEVGSLRAKYETTKVEIAKVNHMLRVRQAIK